MTGVRTDSRDGRLNLPSSVLLDLVQQRRLPSRVQPHADHRWRRLFRCRRPHLQDALKEAPSLRLLANLGARPGAAAAARAPALYTRTPHAGLPVCAARARPAGGHEIKQCPGCTYVQIRYI
jgi:hypothetical protein